MPMGSSSKQHGELPSPVQQVDEAQSGKYPPPSGTRYRPHAQAEPSSSQSPSSPPRHSGRAGQRPSAAHSSPSAAPALASPPWQMPMGSSSKQHGTLPSPVQQVDEAQSRKYPPPSGTRYRPHAQAESSSSPQRPSSPPRHSGRAGQRPSATHSPPSAAPIQRSPSWPLQVGSLWRQHGLRS